MIKYLDTKSSTISIAAKVWIYARLNFGSVQFSHGFSQKKVGEVDVMIASVEPRIKRLSKILKHPNITITRMDAFNALFIAKAQSFIYLDPPYVGAEDVYKSQTFDHAKLYRTLRDVPRGTKWILSHRDDAFIRGLYDGFTIIELDHSYTFKPNHQAGPDRPVTELLISNFLIKSRHRQLAFDI